MEIIESRPWCGFNRRAPHPVVEQPMRFSGKDIAFLEKNWQQLLDSTRQQLLSLDLALDGPIEGSNSAERFCHLFTRIALCLQQATGHRVDAGSILAGTDENVLIALFQFEERSVAEATASLAMQVLRLAAPWFTITGDDTLDDSPLDRRWAAYKSFSKARVLPITTEAIIAAAERAGVPWYKMDRYPFASRPGDSRIRPNGGLGLGQCRHQLLLDGTFCMNRGSISNELLRERQAALRLLRQLQLPQPPDSLDLGDCSGSARARRSARRIGYPLRCLFNQRQGGVEPVFVTDESELGAAVARGGQGNAPILQQVPRGREYRAIIGNGRRLGIIVVEQGEAAPQDLTSSCSAELLAQIDRIANQLDGGLVSVSLVSTDIAHGASFFTDIDVAPKLDDVLPQDSALLARAADSLMAWLFPPGTDCRVPTIGVTGTNGKTTTTNWVHWILRRDHRSPGMAISDGMFDNARNVIASGDHTGFPAHTMMLCNARFDSLALETVQGGMAGPGFAFDICDVAVCTNVTRDHLGLFGINSVEEMTDLKRTLPERARRAVVINADNAATLSMLPFPQAERTCLVSTTATRDQLSALAGAQDLFALVEGEGPQAELVIHDGQERISLARVEDVPATLGGIAGHNISNGLHAAAGCYLMGVSRDALVSGLTSFRADTELNPGRFNVYDEKPFTTIVDYAHNPDGLTQLTASVNKVPVSGKRMITVSAAAYQDDQTVRENALAVAGQFDHYFCFNYLVDFSHGSDATATRLSNMLREAGVPAEQISIVDTELEAVRGALDKVSSGDLLVLLPGRNTRSEIWEMLQSYGD